VGAALAIAAVAVAAILFVILRDDDGDSDTSGQPAATAPAETDANEPAGGSGGGGNGGGDRNEKPKPEPKPKVPTIVVREGQPVGGVQELTFTQGDDMRFTVESDTAAEVHFHGYDVSEEVAAGEKASFDVPAEIEGVFEVELEETAVQIAEITVNPG
jgi:hypothetical protein